MFSQKVLDAMLKSRLAELKKSVVEPHGPRVALGAGRIVCHGAFLDPSDPRVIAGTEEIGQGRWDVDLGGSERRKDELGIFRAPSARWRANSRNSTR